MASRERAIVNNLNERARFYGQSDMLTIEDVRAVMDYYDHECLFCGEPATSIDHVIPLAKRGENKRRNLQLLCVDCNKEKGDDDADHRPDDKPFCPDDFLSNYQQTKENPPENLYSWKFGKEFTYQPGSDSTMDSLLAHLEQSPLSNKEKQDVSKLFARAHAFLHRFDQRQPISKEIRQQVFSLTEGHCFWCGEPLLNDWHVDHFIPFSKGGKDSIDNFVPACQHCNLSKQDKLPNKQAYIKLAALHKGFQATGELQEDGRSTGQIA